MGTHKEYWQKSASEWRALYEQAEADNKRLRVVVV